jgi:hypothetical protein
MLDLYHNVPFIFDNSFFIVLCNKVLVYELHGIELAVLLIPNQKHLGEAACNNTLDDIETSHIYTLSGRAV